jgi:hypothetical protein
MPKERVRGIEPLSTAWKAVIKNHYTIPALWAVILIVTKNHYTISASKNLKTKNQNGKLL